MNGFGQVVSAMFAWAIVLFLFIACLWLVYRRAHVDWLSAAAFTVGALLLGLAGALAATHAIDHASEALPPFELAGIVTCRALAGAIFTGVIIRVTGRPRWAVRWITRLTHGQPWRP